MSAQPVPRSQPPVIRVNEAREVLAYVPHALGFTPTASLVVLSLRPPRGRIGLVARVDLADLDGPQARDVAAGLTQHLRADGAAGVFVVLYTDLPLAEARRSTALEAAARSLERALGARTPVTDVWVVAGDAYSSLRCDDERCCPTEGHELELLGTTRIGAAMVLAGSAPVSRREDLGVGRDADVGRREAFARSARQERRRRARAAREGRTAGWQRTRVATGLAVLRRGDPSPEQLGAVAEAMRDLVVRDAVMTGVLTARTAGSEDELCRVLDDMFGDAATPPTARAARQPVPRWPRPRGCATAPGGVGCSVCSPGSRGGAGTVPRARCTRGRPSRSASPTDSRCSSSAPWTRASRRAGSGRPAELARVPGWRVGEAGGRDGSAPGRRPLTHRLASRTAVVH
ncbi:hypothetical protein C8046_03205 [Serinibacter arcticus]|uniref:DUF4192 domain-containing protein n=1 Tax=Serinibacter arcticus TaxID=1655435 RepID=A0A2U1ZSA4_9MICO|nr:DUF4192 domain-containing protein [Serinibacter arcticus]PWD49841.1 hypothetical protein C8046_03205 [Serinibacter arcticus]